MVSEKGARAFLLGGALHVAREDNLLVLAAQCRGKPLLYLQRRGGRAGGPASAPLAVGVCRGGAVRSPRPRRRGRQAQLRPR